jgi:hypothetical protein
VHELFSHRGDSVVIVVLFGVHIPSVYRILHVAKEFIKCRLGAIDGFESQWPWLGIGFFGPLGVMPAMGVDNLDFELHGSFKTQTIRVGKFSLANIPKPGQVYMPSYEQIIFPPAW